METTEDRVGSRIISDDGFYGTVMYVGEVPPTKGIWLGVDWDDPSRGKHAGCYEGKYYFTASGPTSGSFLRPKKANFGVSCYDAITDRYGMIDDESAGVIQEEMYVVGSGKQMTAVEVVGAKSVNLKQSKLDQLKDVGIRDMKIYGCKTDTELQQCTPNITDLNISKNLLPSWEKVAEIAKQLKKLKMLNVSENRLKLPDDPTQLCSAFTNLTALRMNRMSLTREQVVYCTPMWLKLKELHVCFNNIQTINLPENCLENLELLNLEGNNLSDWEEVMTFGKLKHLSTLILNDTGLKTITLPAVIDGGKTGLFPALRVLSINYNKIDSWASITQLDKLKSFEELKMKGNILLDNYSEESARQLFIAHIAGLKVLNRSEISPQERAGAEFDYLKNFGRFWKQAGGDQDPEKDNPHPLFLEQHPRYIQLLKIYGAPEDSEMFKEQQGALKHQLITVLISSPLLPDQPAKTKKLPLSMTIQKLKVLLQRLYKVDTGDMKLTYISKQLEKSPEIEIDNDLREISFYSIENGDTIHVKW